MSRAQILKHMAPRDIPLFATYFLSPEGQNYTAWEFDVLVGDPDEPGPFFPEAQRRQAMYLNSLKIDAVGWLFETPTLIECKPNGNLGAYGQVTAYRKWYQLIFNITPGCLIVCRRMSRQVKILCDIAEIAVRVVDPASEWDTSRAIAAVRPMVQRKSILPNYRAVSSF